MVVSRSKKDKNAKANNEPVIQPLTNVEKQFFELQIADLNRKLVVLKKQNETIEAENEELQKKIQEMADDRQNATM
jgi:chaperonin cofactor prefoldin